MQIGLGFQTFSDEFGLKGNGRKDLRVGMKSNSGPATADLIHFFQSGSGFAASELLLPLDSATFNASDQTVRKRGHHRRANPMQPTRVRIVEPLELTTGV